MIEDELKTLILSEYGSIRKLASILNMPYSTLDGILRRGVENASIGNIVRICEVLSISVDGLIEGRIIEKKRSKCVDKRKRINADIPFSQ